MSLCRKEYCLGCSFCDQDDEGYHPETDQEKEDRLLQAARQTRVQNQRPTLTIGLYAFLSHRR